MADIIQRAEHRIFSTIRKKRLRNTTPTIISSNCTGGIMYHDLGLQFNSPTVNWGCIGWDYLKFIQNIQHYLDSPVEKLEQGNFRFFLGKCDDLVFQFGHMPTFEDCLEKWNERKKRFNPDNMYVVMTDHAMNQYEFIDGVFHLKEEKAYWDYNRIRQFDELPIEHKVFLSHLPYPELKSVHYIKGFEDKESVPSLVDEKPGYFIRRYLDDFDYVSFLNQK